MKGSSLRALVLLIPVAAAGLCVSGCTSTPTAATTLSTVAISGLTPLIGASAQYTCTATYSDNSTQDCTTKATWVSYNTAVVTVTSTGVVTAVATGSAVLEATYQGVAGTLDITPANGITVSSVAVTGSVPNIGSSSQFIATATMSDGSTQDVTKLASWVAFNTAVATVSPTGVVTAVSLGTAVVKATYLTSSGTFTMTITQ